MNSIWQEIIKLADKSERNIKVISGNTEVGQEECEKLGISSDSVLYSVVSNSNGIVVDNWIRFFGQTSSVNNGVYYYNDNFQKNTSGLFLVASDVVGGLFAINISRFNNENHIWYFAPDTLEWECLNMSYDQLLAWSFQGDIDAFYSVMRWQNWIEDVKDINMNQAMLIYPFLWAKECDIETASKKIVPVDELININFDYSSKFGLS